MLEVQQQLLQLQKRGLHHQLLLPTSPCLARIHMRRCGTGAYP